MQASKVAIRPKPSPAPVVRKNTHILVEELKFEFCANDPCLYVRHEASNVLVIALYVDDLLISGNSKSDIAIIKKELSSRFEMKNLGLVHVMLGIEIQRHRPNRKLFISESEYTKEIFDRFGIFDSKHVAMPMDRSYSEFARQKSASANDVPYQQVIGI